MLRIPAQTLFEPDTTTLRPGAGVSGALQLVSQVLRRRSQLVAQVLVYTDAIGAAAANQGFAADRAQAVVTALQSATLKPNRVLGIGVGEASPLESNATPEGRTHNRRVEIVFGLELPNVPALAASGRRGQ
jgi:outer membrane protein OmpA-like peptidoglycan-associated protein